MHLGRGIQVQSVRRLQARWGLLGPLKRKALLQVAWHGSGARLAVADCVDRVHICDTAAVPSTSGRGQQSLLLPAKMALYHEHQKEVQAQDLLSNAALRPRKQHPSLIKKRRTSGELKVDVMWQIKRAIPDQ